MCLIVKKDIDCFENVEKLFKTPLIAKEDIVVYKVLNKVKRKGFSLYAKSPYQGFMYLKGAKYTAELRMDYDKNMQGYALYIEEGLHAWQSINNGCKLLYNKENNGFITEMIIPKGSKYFLGIHGDIVTNEMIWPTYFKLYTHKLKKYLNKFLK